METPDSTTGQQMLGQMTVEWLIRFLKNQMETNPVTFLPQFGSEQLFAKEKFVAEKEASFPLYERLFYLGKSDASAFGANWTNYAGGQALAKYWLAPGNTIHMSGLLAPVGTPGGISTITILPPAWRPRENEIFNARGWNGTAEIVYRIDVLATGVVQVYNATFTSGWLSISGIFFKAAQIK